MSITGRLASDGPGRLIVKGAAGIPGRLGEIQPALVQQVTTITTPGAFIFLTPAGLVGPIQVEGWGGGGGGGGSRLTDVLGGGGGGGGAYAALTAFAATPNTGYLLSVAAGGAGGLGSTGADGGTTTDTTFNTSSLVARRGAGGIGSAGGGNGGSGGSIALSTGNKKFSGGAGGNAVAGGGGGGSSGGTGSSGSLGGNGGVSAGGAGGIAPSGGGNGGDGGNLGNVGSAGAQPGGGAGGGSASVADKNGGLGGAGKIVLTYESTTGPGSVLVPPDQITGFVSGVIPALSRSQGKLWQDAAKTVPAVADGDPVYVATCPFSGVDYVAGSNAKRPTLKNSGAFWWLAYDGVNNVLTRAQASTQPYTKAACFICTDDQGSPFDGASTNEGFVQVNGAADPRTLSVYAGAALVSSNSVTTANPNVAIGVFNGASSVIQVNTTSTTGAAGAQNSTGETVGSRAGIPSLNCQNLYGYAVYTGAMSAGDRTTLYTYLRSLAP